MMKAQYFVYTRSKNVDYQTFFSPSEDLCPKNLRKKFLNELRGVIDTDKYDDPLDSPRWFYSCSGGLVLFGVGVMNSELSETCYLDFAARPIRGFFGIVMPYSPKGICLPMDLNFFKCLYKKYVEPLWGYEQIQKQNLEIDLGDFADDVNMLYPMNDGIRLNCDKDMCVILGDMEAETVFASAMTIENDISVVAGFKNKRHAYSEDSDYNYMNAIVDGVLERVEKKRVPDVVEEDEDVQFVVTKPKKVLSLKLIVVGILILIALLLFLLPKGGQETQTNQNQSISGSVTNVDGTEKEELKNQNPTTLDDINQVENHE